MKLICLFRFHDSVPLPLIHASLLTFIPTSLRSLSFPAEGIKLSSQMQKIPLRGMELGIGDRKTRECVFRIDEM